MTSPSSPNPDQENKQPEEQAAESPPQDEEVAGFYGEDTDPLQSVAYEDPRVVELAEQLAQTKDQLMRALADAENTRRRAQKDREDSSKFAISGFARHLLPVADNLRRALDAVPDEMRGENQHVQNLVEGIEATEKELLKGFEKHGLRKIAPQDGEVFDPNLHEVMFETPVPGQAGGAIIQVIETGYELNGRLLRPARVGVAKAGDASPPPQVPPQDDPGSQVDTEA